MTTLLPNRVSAQAAKLDIRERGSRTGAGVSAPRSVEKRCPRRIPSPNLGKAKGGISSETVSASPSSKAPGPP
jgi:hypothetical protein